MFTKNPKNEGPKTVLPSEDQVDAEINALMEKTFTVDGQEVSIRSLLPANAVETGRTYIHDATHHFYREGDPNYGRLDWPTVSFTFTDEQGRDGSVTLRFRRDEAGQYILRETNFACSYTQDVTPTARVDYDQGQIVIEGTTVGALTVPLCMVFNTIADMNKALDIRSRYQARAADSNVRQLYDLIAERDEAFHSDRPWEKRSVEIQRAIAFGYQPNFTRQEIADLLLKSFDYPCHLTDAKTAVYYPEDYPVSPKLGGFWGRFHVLRDDQGNSIKLKHVGPEDAFLGHMRDVFVQQALNTKVERNEARLGANGETMEYSLGVLKAIMDVNFGKNAGVRFERVQRAVWNLTAQA